MKATLFNELILSFVLSLSLISGCSKAHNSTPHADAVVGIYDVEVGYVFSVPPVPPLTSWDTVYGHCFLRIEKVADDTLRIIDDSITHKEFIVGYDFDAYGMSWFGDLSDNLDFTQLKTSASYDSIDFSNGDQGVSHLIYTYWRGHKVQ